VMFSFSLWVDLMRRFMEDLHWGQITSRVGRKGVLEGFGAECARISPRI
jgi:hypothetical protein